MTEEAAGERYVLAYDIEHRKVGCVLIQAVLGTLPTGLFYKFFSDSNGWTVDASACQRFETTEEDLPKIAAGTDFTRGGR
jgi:hypothetical protein